ncbi:MAG: hypothetical protein F4Z77_07305, partial [Dehalococcoidia bacterium]|nr:hypothetical protein [Dehalococcoidia bacterium]
MKTAVIAALMALIAVGGAFTAFAVDRTVETTVELEVEFWVDLETSSAFVSTRQEGEQWVTHDFRVPLKEFPGLSTLLHSDPVTIAVPVSIEVETEEAEVEEVPLVPLAPARPQPGQGERPTGRATCCTVRGMSDNRTAQRAIATEMRKVITYARTNLGLTHEGPITINVAYVVQGLNLRYRDAFGVELEERPSDCAFQQGSHMFFGPSCRGDAEEIARQWFIRATQRDFVSVRWLGVATFEYYWTWYRTGKPPTVRDDRYRSAIYHQEATALRQGRGHDDLMTAGALFALERYGTEESWVALYRDLLDGAEIHTAFEEWFGVSLLRFYQDFEAWAAQERTEMLALAYGSCREASRYIEPRLFEEGGGFPDYRVPLEYDHDGDGYVCEQYARFEEEELLCVV